MSIRWTLNVYSGVARPGEGVGEGTPSCFGKFVRNFLRFSEKVSLKFSLILEENKHSFTFSPILENTPLLFSPHPPSLRILLKMRFHFIDLLNVIFKTCRQKFNFDK